MKFQIHQEDSSSAARLGEFETAHGVVETPIFMPVGTRAAVKAVTHRQVKEIGAQIILGNTYHLLLKPGMEIIEAAGGLHQFMDWDLPILTDSGGFQVFSLSGLNKITEAGVEFQSHIDGSRYFLGPKESMEVQRTLGSDIVMVFDECSPYPCTEAACEAALERTSRWAKTCREYSLKEHQNLFGIVQGGVHPHLRRRSAEALNDLDFEGYAIGGLSVGEPADVMYEVLDHTTHLLPEEKPRYLMGVGTPRNIVEAVSRGVDMFDCVMPTRNARNGTAFTWQGKINVGKAKFKDDFSPLDPELDSFASSYSKAYLRHLFNVGEITGMTLLTIQNLAFYLDFMEKLRQSLREGTFADFYKKVCSIYPN